MNNKRRQNISLPALNPFLGKIITSLLAREASDSLCEVKPKARAEPGLQSLKGSDLTLLSNLLCTAGFASVLCMQLSHAFWEEQGVW